MTARILAFTRYEGMGASSRVRFLQYVPHLERMGLQVTVCPLLPDEYLERLYARGTRSWPDIAVAQIKRVWQLLSRRDHDIVWLQRELLPFVPFLLERAFLGRRKLVIDLDDAHHLYYKQAPSALLRALYGNKIERLLKRADAVVVGNESLAEMARRAGARNAHVVYSAVDTSRYAVKQRAAGEPFKIGWIGTPVTAQEALPIVRDAIVQFLAEHEAGCVIVGAGPAAPTEIPGEQIPWSEAAAESVLPTLSVGLCPLADTEWNRGKSGYKIIQYMAAGVPTLASPVGIASQIVEHGQTGYHCRSTDDWY
ncbi:MAG: glycosyltransferase, partial [Rhodospirillaceae bacterium]